MLRVGVAGSRGERVFCLVARQKVPKNMGRITPPGERTDINAMERKTRTGTRATGETEGRCHEGPLGVLTRLRWNARSTRKGCQHSPRTRDDRREDCVLGFGLFCLLFETHHYRHRIRLITNAGRPRVLRRSKRVPPRVRTQHCERKQRDWRGFRAGLLLPMLNQFC